LIPATSQEIVEQDTPVIRNITDMDLRLLRIFAIVVKCAGFTAAQAELNMSQSNISTHISSLEKRLGYRICERGKGGFRLTEKGQRILKASAALFGAVDAFRDETSIKIHMFVGWVLEFHMFGKGSREERLTVISRRWLARCGLAPLRSGKPIAFA
jgi:DNA-binding transcriptional LysR family regulator